MLYEIREWKQAFAQRGPDAVLAPKEEARLRNLKASADERLAQYRAFAAAYKTIIAGLEAASGRTERRRGMDLLDEMIQKEEAEQAAKQGNEPPQELVLRAMEVGVKDKAAVAVNC